MGPIEREKARATPRNAALASTFNLAIAANRILTPGAVLAYRAPSKGKGVNVTVNYDAGARPSTEHPTTPPTTPSADEIWRAALVLRAYLASQHREAKLWRARAEAAYRARIQAAELDQGEWAAAVLDDSAVVQARIEETRLGNRLDLINVLLSELAFDRGILIRGGRP